MNVTAYVVNVAASALLAGSVWAQNPSQNPPSSQIPQTPPGQSGTWQCAHPGHLSVGHDRRAGAAAGDGSTGVRQEVHQGSC